MTLSYLVYKRSEAKKQNDTLASMAISITQVCSDGGVGNPSDTVFSAHEGIIILGP